MRHFYRSQLPPHDVLLRADAFFPQIGLAPLGVLDLSHLHLLGGRGLE